MPYATPTDLLFFGAQELAQLAAPEDNSVDGPLIQATIEGTGRSAYTAAAQAAADAALVRLNTVLEQASNYMDGYLSGRYQLPLAAALVSGSNLGPSCSRIARYMLMGDAPTEAATQQYAQATAWLRDVAKGVATLGAADTNVATETGRIVVQPGNSNFPWENY